MKLGGIRLDKLNLVYWSGTGNTEQMAELIKEGITSNGKAADLVEVSDANASTIEGDVIVLGCPSMGAEVLEESEMEPFMEDIDDKVKDKVVFLFGSYDWGDGEWMRNWVERVESNGAKEVESIIVNNTPDSDEDIENLKGFGAKISAKM